MAAAAAMAGIVVALDHAVALPEIVRLPVLVSTGGSAYAALLWLLARGAVIEAVALVRDRD